VLKKIDLYVYILRLFRERLALLDLFVIAISRECLLFDLDIRQEVDTFSCVIVCGICNIVNYLYSFMYYLDVLSIM